MKFFLKRRYINVISLFSTCIIVFLSVFFYFQIIKFERAHDLVLNTYQVMESATNILVDSNYLEGKLRGYFLTNDKSYLTNYEHTIQSIYQNIGELEVLVKDNPVQAAHVEQFKKLLNARFELHANLIKTFETRGIQPTVKLVLIGKQTISIDRIQQAGHQIIAAEKEYLINRSQIAVADSQHMVLLIILGNGISLTLILLAIYLLNKQLSSYIRTSKKLRASEGKLFRLAYYDSLTKLPNHTSLLKQLEEMIASTQYASIAILLLDIDNFKNINDSLSHELGDEFIALFAKRLQKIAPAKSRIFHINSDEFALLITDFTQIENINLIAQEIMDDTARAVVVRNHHIFVTVSMGISIYPNNGIDAKVLLKNAEIGMSRAKELGKNNYQFCTPEMTIEVEKRALLDYNLHQALARNEFVLFYQPKISLKDNQIVGVEALMRWNRPNSGWIYPANFISLAESNGLIVPISEWMLRTACIQALEWQEAGLPIFNVAINVSPRQLVISDFVATVYNIVSETGFDPKFLELEITESILMEQSSNNLNALRALKEMGIKITIDDFGTGYSALSYLTLFPIDKLKLDKSFLEHSSLSRDQPSIISAIIAMAHSLGIEVAAEGVEKLTQVAFLRKHHCDEAQGFFYSHPLPANELAAFVSNY